MPFTKVKINEEKKGIKSAKSVKPSTMQKTQKQKKRVNFLCYKAQNQASDSIFDDCLFAKKWHINNSTLQVICRLFCRCFHKFFCVTFTQIEEFPMHSHLNVAHKQVRLLFQAIRCEFCQKLPTQFFYWQSLLLLMSHFSHESYTSFCLKMTRFAS